MKAVGIKIWIAVFCLLLVSSLSLAGSKNDQRKRIKKRVAVLVFDDKTDHRGHWWGNKGVGEGLSDMITTEPVL